MFSVPLPLSWPLKATVLLLPDSAASVSKTALDGRMVLPLKVMAPVSVEMVCAVLMLPALLPARVSVTAPPVALLRAVDNVTPESAIDPAPDGEEPVLAVKLIAPPAVWIETPG